MTPWLVGGAVVLALVALVVFVALNPGFGIAPPPSNPDPYGLKGGIVTGLVGSLGI